MRVDFLEALMMKHQAAAALAVSNIRTYLENPAGIGEHPDLTDAIEVQTKLYNESSEMIESLNALLLEFGHEEELNDDTGN
jgi:hypothetical protein